MTKTEQTKTAGENKLAPLDDAFSWKASLVVVVCVTLLLAACHYWIQGALPKKLIAVQPRDVLSLPAAFLSNLFHLNEGHLAGNLLTFWILGLWALKKEGSRAVAGMWHGAVFYGGAVWLFGKAGVATLGFSGVVFSLMGVLVISSIRTGFRTTVYMCVAVYLLFIAQTGTLSIWPRGGPENVSWLGHLGGMIGGMYSQIKNPVIALRILAEKGFVNAGEIALIHQRITGAAQADAADKADASDGPSPEKIGEPRQAEAPGESARITCDKCGAINNVPAGRRGRPACGKCGAALPWSGREG